MRLCVLLTTEGGSYSVKLCVYSVKLCGKKIEHKGNKSIENTQSTDIQIEKSKPSL